MICFSKCFSFNFRYKLNFEAAYNKSIANITESLDCSSCVSGPLTIQPGSVVVTSRIFYYEDDLRIDDFKYMIANETSQRFSDEIFGSGAYSPTSVAVKRISFPLTFPGIDLADFDDKK